MASRFYSKRLRDKAKKQARKRRASNRPKSFKTEEAAKKWAETNKVANYTLRNLKSSASKTKKLVIVLGK